MKVQSKWTFILKHFKAQINVSQFQELWSRSFSTPTVIFAFFSYFVEDLHV